MSNGACGGDKLVVHCTADSSLGSSLIIFSSFLFFRSLVKNEFYQDKLCRPGDRIIYITNNIRNKWLSYNNIKHLLNGYKEKRANKETRINRNQ